MINYTSKKDGEFDIPRSNISRHGRNLYFFDSVNECSVMEAIKHIANMQIECKKKPITMFINSPGGSCYDGLALYDCMRACPAPIITVGLGIVASMGFIIYLAGDKRISAPYTRYLNHQVSSYFEGKATDIEIQKKEVDVLEQIAIDIVSDRTGMKEAMIKKSVKVGDNYFSAKEALKHGIVHKIFSYADKSLLKDIQLPEPTT